MFCLPKCPIFRQLERPAAAKRDWNFVAKQSLPAGPHADGAKLERAAKIADIRDRMALCLEELDKLDLPYAGNHLSHAIALLDDKA